MNIADWLVFWAYYQKSQEHFSGNESKIDESTAFGNETSSMHPENLAWNDQVRNFFELRFANLMDYCIPAFVVSYLFFFAIGGYLHVSCGFFSYYFQPNISSVKALSPWSHATIFLALRLDCRVSQGYPALSNPI